MRLFLVISLTLLVGGKPACGAGPIIVEFDPAPLRTCDCEYCLYENTGKKTPLTDWWLNAMDKKIIGVSPLYTADLTREQGWLTDQRHEYVDRPIDLATGKIGDWRYFEQTIDEIKERYKAHLALGLVPVVKPPPPVPEAKRSVLKRNEYTVERTLPFYHDLDHAKEDLMLRVEERLVTLGQMVSYHRPPDSVVARGILKIKWSRVREIFGDELIASYPWPMINLQLPGKSTVDLEVAFGDLLYVIEVTTASYAFDNSDGSVGRKFAQARIWRTAHQAYVEFLPDITPKGKL